MKMLRIVRGLVALMFFVLSAATVGAIELEPAVSTGLTSPVFVTHAGDGSNRLFIVEQGGTIRVLQPGASTPTLFLDISANVLSGGERGLVGLAFHPQYRSNGRFFVFYTRTGDGALVIAEYHVSGNPNVADSTETPILTIAHPTNANHNGGMLAFGPDGFLYIGTGDGGSANDPPNNSQNISVLLGKILRIDINTPGIPYVAPATNPFVGRTGQDEIFAYGFRNPWRFSFDRLTGQQWVADVGQGTREEVDTPIQLGGNYGWRVYEGFNCTGNDMSLCNPNNYLFPIFDYTHSGGRCSITGGYVYRGTQGALPDGTYIYGDYCSGEIFGWDGTTQNRLLDTTMNISSFGEDEAGEVYVVNLGGSVSRIVASTSCTYSIAPTSQDFAAAGGTGTTAVTAGTSCPWSAVANVSWLHITSGASGSGNGNVGYSVDTNTSTSPRSGTLTVAGQTFTVNQAGAPPACPSAINPTSANFTRNSATASVTVTIPAGCMWTAVSNVSWITITGGSNGTGSGTVSYSVAPYGGPPKNRTGTMTIAGKTFTVKQTK